MSTHHKSARGLLAHPAEIHSVTFHLLVLLAYVVAFWIYLHPEVAHIHSWLDRAAFVVGASLLLGWISGVDVGVNFHNHTHRLIFRHAWLNRWFGRQWTVVGGWPSVLWHHAHVHVHHGRLMQAGDWTLPRRRSDGRFENPIVYLLAHWPWRYAVAFYHEIVTTPSLRRRAPRELTIFLALWSIPFWIDPTMALVLWVLPHWLANVLIMGPGMYVQHAGCMARDAAHPHQHSNEYLSRFFNLTMFNIGYHIEHHESARTHWSELPSLHERMADELEASGGRILQCGYYAAGRMVTRFHDFEGGYRELCEGEAMRVRRSVGEEMSDRPS